MPIEEKEECWNCFEKKDPGKYTICEHCGLTDHDRQLMEDEEN